MLKLMLIGVLIVFLVLVYLFGLFIGMICKNGSCETRGDPSIKTWQIAFWPVVVLPRLWRFIRNGGFDAR
jgi:hypothetical protein